MIISASLDIENTHKVKKQKKEKIKRRPCQSNLRLATVIEPPAVREP
jgi:hypothetical protein